LRVYRKALALLTPRERRRGALVLGLMIAMAALETAGVASVMPFLTVLANPAAVEGNRWLAALYAGLEFRSIDAFLIALGAATFATVLLAAAVRTITHYAMNRFVELRRHALSERLLETYLRQSYRFFLERHTADLAKSILSEVDLLVVHVLRPAMQMLAYGLVALAIVALLAAVDPWLAAGVAAVIGGLYAAVFLVVRGLLGRGGSERLRANRERFTAAGEALSGIKDIKLLGREDVYLQRFRGPSRRFSRRMATSQTLAQVPKFFVEAVGFGGVIALAVALLAVHGGAASGGLEQVLPMLGLYAFGAYRLLPAAQHVYQGMAKLRFAAAAVDSVYADLQEREALAEIREAPAAPLLPRRTIALEGLSFTYPGAVTPALHGVDLSIPVGGSLALVGPTGSGKTTLVDLLLGLLRPSEGALVIDGEPLTDDRVAAWQGALGYVPQEIFFTDASVAENIALGVPPERIDREQVSRCAQIAQIHEFVTERLPQQLDTVIGERGVRLSGGQRQRLGIARALYHEPAVLVLDEATSALDKGTEAEVLDAIAALGGERTVVLVTHRPETAQRCDQVAVLENGRLRMRQGAYRGAPAAGRAAP